MRDFDETRAAITDRDRRFKIGGREFDVLPQPLPARVLATYFDLLDSPEGTENLNAKIVDAADAVIRAGLDDGGRDQWDALRADGSSTPLSIRDVQQVASHVIEVTSVRPTGQSSGSGSGSGNPGTSSTAGSQSEGVD